MLDRIVPSSPVPSQRLPFLSARRRPSALTSRSSSSSARSLSGSRLRVRLLSGSSGSLATDPGVRGVWGRDELAERDEHGDDGVGEDGVGEDGVGEDGVGEEQVEAVSALSSTSFCGVYSSSSSSSGNSCRISCSVEEASLTGVSGSCWLSWESASSCRVRDRVILGSSDGGSGAPSGLASRDSSYRIMAST